MTFEKKNVTKMALADTVEYIKSLQVSKTVETQVKRYLALHKKGVNIGFSFGSNGLKSSFDHFIIRFKLDPTLTDIIDVNEKVSTSKKHKFLNKESALKKKEMQVQHSLKNYKNAMTNAKSLHTGLPEEYLNSKEYTQTTKVLDLLIEHETNAYKRVIQSAKDGVDTLRNLSRLQRNLSANIGSLEGMWEKLISKFYIGRVRHYLEEMFPNDTIVIRYKDYNWFDKERMNRSLEEDEYIEGFNRFEDKMYNWIRYNELNFRLEIIKGDYKGFFHSGSAGVNTYRYPKPAASEYATIREVNEKIENFFLRNPSFYIMLKTSQLLEQHVRENTITRESIMHHLINDQRVLVEEYNGLVEEKKNAVEEEPDMYRKPPELNELFPEVTFHTEEVENFFYDHIGGDKTKTVVKQLETDNFVFNTYYVKPKSLI